MKKSALIKKQVRRVLRHVLRFIVVFLSGFGVPQMLFPVRNVSKNLSSISLQQNFLCLAIGAALFTAAVSITSSNDLDFAKRWQKKQPKESLFTDLKFLLTDPLFLIKAGAFLLLLLVLPLSWVSLSLRDLTGFGSGFFSKLPVVPAISFVCLILALCARRHAMQLFRDGYLPDEKKNIRAYVSMFVYIFSIITGAGVLCVLALPFILAFFISLFSKTGAMIALTVGFFVFLILAIVFSVLLLRRRRFLRELREVCRLCECELTVRKTAYLSVFCFINRESFHLVHKGKSYSCMLITARRKFLPLIVDASGKCVFHHNLTLWGAELFRMDIRRAIDYPTPDRRLLIFSPAPNKLLARERGALAPLDNGGSVGDYKVFIRSAFLRAIERGILDR